MLNNPLKYTDPSGHFFSSLLHLIEKIGSFLVSYAPTIVSIATAAILGSGATFLQAVLHGAAAGFMGGLVGSGSLHGALDGAFWGGITAGVVRGVGHGFGYGNSPSPFGSGKWLVHGIAQGTISELRGGNFRSGFVGAVAGCVADGASGRVMGSLGVAINVGSLTAVAGIFGGLAAKASGGSFKDGAVSAAFTHLFNYEATVGTWGTAPKPIDWEWLGKGLSGIGRAINVLTASLSLSGSTPNYKYIYRVVGDEELAKILLMQGFPVESSPSGFEEKQFWLSINDARWYKAASDSWGGALSIVEGRISNKTLSLGYRFLDVGHPAVSFHFSILPKVNEDVRQYGGVNLRG